MSEGLFTKPGRGGELLFDLQSNLDLPLHTMTKVWHIATELLLDMTKVPNAPITSRLSSSQEVTW